MNDQICCSQINSINDLILFLNYNCIVIKSGDLSRVVFKLPRMIEFIVSDKSVFRGNYRIVYKDKKEYHHNWMEEGF